ncbi:MAG: hypothetical protein JWO03_3385 [Bacteroidetes bacterium]|nr:hypothetical protein [Bacteroidota bacterium]
MHRTTDIFQKLIGLLLFTAVSVDAFPARYGAAADDWKLGTEKDGIKVYTRKTEQSKMRTSRAEMFVPVSVDQILSVLNDFNSYGGWFPSCKDARILKRINDHEFMAILTYKTPWPLPNLDCVERVILDRKPGNDTSYIRVKAEPDYAPMVKDVSRVKQMEASWKLISVKGGTYVINEYYSDMGGLVPAWIGNTQAVEIPYNIFSGIKQRIIALFKKK